MAGSIVLLKMLKKNNANKNQMKSSSLGISVKCVDGLKIQLSNLFQSEIIDTDAEIKVFESMLKSEGINTENDFDLK